jgi:predicted ATP-grasp superfamily ATP-dependent carboligase/CelD/BcsL family acetyltransferase involved in cellulose biosynthesis
MKVLVTDGNSRAALTVTRALGSAGHEVIVAARQTSSLAQASRYCAGRAVYPDPMTEPDRFIDVTADLVRASGIDCVLPIADLTTFLVTAHRDRFEPACAVPFADANIIERVADKVDLVQTAARLGVAVPRSVVVMAPDLVPRNEIEFPLVVKPWRSRVKTGGGWASTSVSHAADAGALRRDLEARAPYEFPVMLQERIEGPGLGVFACYHDGRPVALFSHRRLRERPPWGGVSVLSESIELPARAREYATRLLDAIGWQGVAMVEFKVDRRDGEPKLMEINGRFWGSLQLAIDSGVNFPLILLQTLGSGHVETQTSYHIGVRNRWLWGDVDSLLQMLGRWQGPRDLRSSRIRAAWQFMKFLGADLYYDNPKWDDPWPFAVETGQRLRALVQRVGGTPEVPAFVSPRVVTLAPRAHGLSTRVVNRMSDGGLDQKAWNALAAGSDTNTVFQTYQWTKSWLDVYGDLHEPFLLIADNHDGPAAVAPLATSQAAKRPERVLRFIGDGRADYCDFLVSGTRRDGLSALVNALLDNPAWDQIDLRNIPATSATPDAVRAACEERGLRFVMRDQYLCPTLRIHGHEAEAFRILNKPSLRRCLRGFERAGRHAEYDMIAASEIEPRLTGFFEQHIARWEDSPDPSLFLHERNRTFYRTLTRVLDGTGWLLFSVIELDGRPAALHFGFDYNGTVLWYKPSFDPAFASLSPGNVMVRHLMDYALRQNRRELDFTVGNEPFKQRFTNLTRKTVQVQVYRNALVQMRSQTRQAVDALSRTVQRSGALKPV